MTAAPTGIPVRASAPGRVNLIGEHTDYNEGFVLPMAIPQRTAVDLRPTGGTLVSIRSDELGSAAYRLGEEAAGKGWVDYVQGVTWALRVHHGFELGGFEARIRSDVPVGAGLSSSAALEVALLRALREAFGLALDDVRLALAGQRAETDFVGAPVGPMDQLAASLADDRTALFLDTRDLSYERVALPERIEPVVISSGLVHRHASGDYRRRRAECEEAARLLGVRALRDAAPGDEGRLPPPLDRRARHVLRENARVLALVEAFRARRLETIGPLLQASHASQRDDFEVSIPEIDRLVALASAQPGVLGARLTGGGFGGSILALARRGTGRPAARAIATTYQAETGHRGRVLVPQP